MESEFFVQSDFTNTSPGHVEGLEFGLLCLYHSLGCGGFVETMRQQKVVTNLLRYVGVSESERSLNWFCL